MLKFVIFCRDLPKFVIFSIFVNFAIFADLVADLRYLLKILGQKCNYFFLVLKYQVLLFLQYLLGHLNI